jgi:ribonuclease T2
MRRMVWLAAALVAAGCSQEAAEAPASAPNTSIVQTVPKAPPTSNVPEGKRFDFYVLSLSWSPSYCEAEGEDANRQQCAAGRPYAFVVHGLWPQFERGYPENCPTGQPDVSSETLRSLYDLMPSAGLIRYQWRKHGSCSGLGQRDYFDVLRAARETVSIPQEFRRLNSYRTLDPDDAEAAFLKANPSLPAAAIAVTCDKRYLREVRVCMTTDLKFHSCPEIDRRECRLGKVVMPPVRGG